MDSRKLRSHIGWQRPVYTSNNRNGEKLTAWADVRGDYAAIEPLSGRQLEIAKTFAATTTHRVTVRYQRDVQIGWRFTYAGRAFTVDGFINVHELGKELTLFCTEVHPK